MSEQGAPGAVRDNANVVIGVVLVVLGILFFVAQYTNVDMGRVFWPFFIIVPGLAFFVAMTLVGKNAAPLAIPGSVVTTVGLILLYQNASGHWESWSYVWALIPTAVGIGIMIQGMWSDQPKVRENGMQVAKVGIVLFVIFGAFFELVLNISGFFGMGQWLWPLLLIALGVFLLVGRGFGKTAG